MREMHAQAIGPRNMRPCIFTSFPAPKREAIHLAPGLLRAFDRQELKRHEFKRHDRPVVPGDRLRNSRRTPVDRPHVLFRAADEIATSAGTTHRMRIGESW
jgi:hypothetical protein